MICYGTHGLSVSPIIYYFIKILTSYANDNLFSKIRLHNQICYIVLRNISGYNNAIFLSLPSLSCLTSLRNRRNYAFEILLTRLWSLEFASLLALNHSDFTVLSNSSLLLRKWPCLLVRVSILRHILEFMIRFIFINDLLISIVNHFL